jgi:hypothetical protein
MTDEEPVVPFVLFIGSLLPDAAVSRLKASDVFYRQKKLESSPENWDAIIDLLRDENLIAVVAKFTKDTFERIVLRGYEEKARELCAAMTKVSHILFIHETLLAPDPPDTEPADGDSEDLLDDEDSYYEYLQRSWFTPPSPEVRDAVKELVEEYRLNLLPYVTNAQLAVLAAGFIEDNDKNLLFRIYVPRGRLYANEADKLLALFREWLTRVKKQRVRQDGYMTGSGQVYELFGEEPFTSVDLADQFTDFSRFLELCAEDPVEASRRLTEAGVPSAEADDLVTRYGKESQRLQLDLRHARESKLLSIRQRLESELIEIVPLNAAEWNEIDRIVETQVPEAPSLRMALSPGESLISEARPVSVTINQQIVQSVEGAVIQGVEGTVNLSSHSQQITTLVHEYGGNERAALESAIHEVEDPDARPADRLAAKQRLKGFLFKLGGKVEDAVIQALIRYLEGKSGM